MEEIIAVQACDASKTEEVVFVPSLHGEGRARGAYKKRTSKDPYKKRQRVDGVIVEGQLSLRPVMCLGHCGERFQPAHKGNRICPKCTEINLSINGREYRVIRGEGD